MTFQIDGSDVKDPTHFDYDELYSPFRDLYGIAVVSAYREATAYFDVIKASDFTAWITACDEASHSIKCYAPNSTMLTTYSNVYVEFLGGNISNGVSLYYYDLSFKVRHISTAGLSAFGSV